MSRLYPLMTVHTLPSRHEGLGMVVLEAAANGVPSVITDASGVRDAGVPGVTCYVSRAKTGGIKGGLGLAEDKVNPNGGAIAMGHPLGMSGARVVLTLAHELKRRGGGVGAAALCGGGGQGDALIVRVPSA